VVQRAEIVALALSSFLRDLKTANNSHLYC
jgi:hypothetical protein